MSKTNDRSLRFYNEVLGLDRLHYGLWLPDDELTFENLKKAQERYESYLIDNIPNSVKNVLDVGCGTGALTKKLIDLSYQVEGLSPDVNQKIIFEKDIVKAPFHHLAFEDFSIADKFDCIIMSESCQYINLEKIFENAKRSLKKNGYLMICDYFVFDNASGELSKSGHNYNIFMHHAKSNNFKVVSEEDITESITKTLDLGKDLIERILIAFGIGTEKIRDKHPYTSKFVLWLLRKKIQKATKQIELLDADEFMKNKTYRFILLQNNN